MDNRRLGCAGTCRGHPAHPAGPSVVPYARMYAGSLLVLTVRRTVSGSNSTEGGRLPSGLVRAVSTETALDPLLWVHRHSLPAVL